MKKECVVVFILVLFCVVCASAAENIVVIPLVRSDSNLLPENIRSGVTIFGVEGTYGTDVCPTGLTACRGNCIDTRNNPNYCGDCSTECDSYSYCNEGVCTIPPGLPGHTCEAHTDCLYDKCISGTCAVESKFVFLSSTEHNGALGGLIGANVICQSLADNAGLPGTYKAWLSDSSGSPSTDFTKADVPYMLVNGIEIAGNWDDLIDGTLSHPIKVNENGKYSGRSVWTGTSATGGEMTNNCSDWEDASLDNTGEMGKSNVVDSRWTEEVDGSCANQYLRIFCFEQ